MVCWRCRPTDGVHDGVGQQDSADADPRQQADQARDDVRVVDIDGLGDGLEAEQQGLNVLKITVHEWL